VAVRSPLVVGLAMVAATVLASGCGDSTEQAQRPGPGNTGVPAGTPLRPYSGTLTVVDDGAVIDALDVAGCIVVRADNVTIRRTRVRGAPCDNGHQVDIGYGTYEGLVLEDVEIDGMNIGAKGAAIGNSNFTCRRCNIHRVGQGVAMTANVTVEDSWIHDLYQDGESHNEPIITLGGTNFVIRNNVLDIRNEGGASASLALYNAFERLDDVLVENNVFNGGSYCVYAGKTHGDNPVTNVRFLDNRFGRKYDPSCGIHGPYTAFEDGGGNVWSGNVWDDTGEPVGP
jgi:hypothetical protein